MCVCVCVRVPELPRTSGCYCPSACVSGSISASSFAHVGLWGQGCVWELLRVSSCESRAGGQLPRGSHCVSVILQDPPPPPRGPSAPQPWVSEARASVPFPGRPGLDSGGGALGGGLCAEVQQGHLRRGTVMLAGWGSSWRKRPGTLPTNNEIAVNNPTPVRVSETVLTT